MIFLLELFFNLVSGFVAVDFILGFNNKKWLDKKSYFLLPIVYGIALEILNLTISAGLLETILTLITLYGISLYIDKENKIKAVYMIALFYTTLLVVNMSVVSIAGKLFGVSGNYVIFQNYALRYILIVIIKLVLFAILRTYLLINNINGNISKGESLFFILFPVVTILIIIPIAKIINYSDLSNEYYIYFLLSVIGLLILNIIIYFFYSIRIHNINVENDLKQQIIKNDNEIKNLELYRESMNVAKKIKHDIKNHLLVISGYIKDNRNEDAQNYIREIAGSVESISSYIALDDPVINYLVNSKIEAARNKFIDVKIEVDKSISMPKINEYELCSILGNILDNAIENTKSYGNMTISIGKKKGYFNITVKNTVKDFNNSDLVTSKADAENHGLGLPIIREKISKNNGMLAIYSKNDTFCVSAYLPF